MAQTTLLGLDSTVAKPLDVDFTLFRAESKSRYCYRVILKRGLMVGLLRSVLMLKERFRREGIRMKPSEILLRPYPPY